MGKWCLHASSFIFYQIVIKVAGNQDRHKSSDEFDFRPLVSMAHLYVFEMRFDLGTLDSGERSLPFGLLVMKLSEISPDFQWKSNTRKFHWNSGEILLEFHQNNSRKSGQKAINILLTFQWNFDDVSYYILPCYPTLFIILLHLF